MLEGPKLSNFEIEGLVLQNDKNMSTKTTRKEKEKLV
jgi:hypothetical protein